MRNLPARADSMQFEAIANVTNVPIKHYESGASTAHQGAIVPFRLTNEARIIETWQIFQ